MPSEEVLRKGLSLGHVSDESLVGQFSHSPPGWVQFTQSQHKDRTQSKGVRFSKPKMTTSNPDKLCLATRDRPSQMAFAALPVTYNGQNGPLVRTLPSRPSAPRHCLLGPRTLSAQGRCLLGPRASPSGPRAQSSRPKSILFSTQGHCLLGPRTLKTDVRSFVCFTSHHSLSFLFVCGC